MLPNLIAEFFDNQFRPTMPSAGMPDESAFGGLAVEMDDNDLEEAIAHQDASNLRVDLLSDEALEDLVIRASAEWVMRPAKPGTGVVGRIGHESPRNSAA